MFSFSLNREIDEAYFDSRILLKYVCDILKSSCAGPQHTGRFHPAMFFFRSCKLMM